LSILHQVIRWQNERESKKSAGGVGERKKNFLIFLTGQLSPSDEVLEHNV